MNQSAWIERNAKRELRAIYRNKRLEHEQKKRAQKKERAKKEALISKGAMEVFFADNKRHEKPCKKPGPEKFLEMYSYISATVYDTRHCIPPSWKPNSFNERKQHLEFIKRFIYPYQIPETLLWATHLPEYAADNNGKLNKTPDYVFIQLAKKWVTDIVSGESFFKRNKDFFTKAEAHHFLQSRVSFIDGSSVIALYFYAKCRARSLNHKLSLMIADVFTVKFLSHFKDKLVEGFLDLLARTPEYRYERGTLGDLCDFVLEKIQENKKNGEKPGTFSFSGRTIFSVTGLANEWHERLRRETEAARQQREAFRRGRLQNHRNEKTVDASHWKGMGFAQFRHETDECIWTVTELRTAQDLLNEGRKMKNCVSSYTYKCASGSSAIFTLERVYRISQAIEKAATLEVNIANRTLVQAKGKCNTKLTPTTLHIVTRWAQANGIAVRLLT